MTLKTLTINDIRALDPCYDPSKFLPEDWTGTALDILSVEACPPDDRLWVVLRDGFIGDDIMRSFARWCASQVINLWAAPQVVKDYLETGDESMRAAAWAAAWSAARSAPQVVKDYLETGDESMRDAARDAAWSAARDAARDAARYAAWAAARDAAWAAAWSAAWDVEWDAAWDVAWDAAWDVARDAARAAQINHLIEMIEAL